jgi:hypothetical protein
MIFVPRHKELILPMRQIVRIRGHFKIETQEAGKPRRVRAEFHNLITNNGLDLLCTSGSFMTACCVGTGNATPLVTNTALQALVASTTATISSTNTIQSTSPYYGSLTMVYNFPAGSATGNLAEVGVGASATNLLSRALILNGSGSPTTITVLSSEALYVTYTLQQIVPTSDVTGSATISGTSYSYTLRASQATNVATWSPVQSPPLLSSSGAYNGTIGTVTGAPSGSGQSADSTSTAGYTTGTYTLSYTATWGLTSGNLSGGITALTMVLNGSRGCFQIGLGTAIPKDGSHVLVLNYSTVWSA